MTDNKNAVKNLAEVICERSEVIAELIVACVTAVKTSSYVATDASDTNNEGCAMVKQAVPVVSSEEVKPKKKKVSSTRKEREEAEVLPEEITEESLAEVSYNGLKKLAKDLGVSASGDRETLTANILASVSGDEVEEDEEDSEEEVTSNEEEIEDAEFSEEDEDNEDEEEEDSLAEQIEQATKDMTVEELADLLVSYELPAKGKRQALIDAIIKGVEDGIIEFNTGDDVDEEEEEIDDAETVEEEVDEEEVDDSPRGKAVQELKDSIEAEFEEGSISRKDLITYINKRMGTKNRMKTVDDADLLAKYCELQATLIDDEGDLHEEKEPYVLNDEYHCCGEVLQKDEDGDLVCPICGTCYDGE